MAKTMPKPKHSPAPVPPPLPEMPKPDKLDAEALSFLLKECESLGDHYSQCQSRVEGRFNFFLLILSAVFGIVALGIQGGARSMIWLLLGAAAFVCLVGIAFEISIVALYAEIAFYSSALEELREYLVRSLSATSAPLYSYYLKPKETPHLDRRFWWLPPRGLFRLFVALVNGFCLASLFPLAMLALGLYDRLLLASLVAVIVFILALIIQNAYAIIIARRNLSGFPKMRIASQQ